MQKIWLEAAGWYGTVAIVGAYALLSFSVLTADSLLYQGLNLTGGLGIVAISLHKQAYQPAVLNIIWSLIGCVAILKTFF